MIKYNKLRIKYKFEGLAILENLKNNINSLFTINKKIYLFDVDETYQYIPYDLLKHILMTKWDYFNENNQYIIREYILKLIKLYVFIAELLINKIDENKKKDIHKYIKIKEKVQNERKLYNTNLAKKMIEEKREAAAKKLMDKWNKKVIIDTKKLDVYKKNKLNKSVIIEHPEEKKNKINDKFDVYNSLVDEDI